MAPFHPLVTLHKSLCPSCIFITTHQSNYTHSLLHSYFFHLVTMLNYALGCPCVYKSFQNKRVMMNLRYPEGEEVNKLAPKGLKYIFGHIRMIHSTVLVPMQCSHTMRPYVPHSNIYRSVQIQMSPV